MNVTTPTIAGDATAWATVLLFMVTAILAGVGIRQAVLTRRALQAAEQDTMEATRARIDQRAPSVVLTAWASAASTREWLVDVNPTDRYHLPSDADLSMALTGWFRVTNEGHSTAIVDVPEGVLVLAGTQPVVSLNSINRPQRPSGHQKFPLGPGKSQVLLVETRRTFGEWAALNGTDGATAPAIRIVVDDTFAQGTRDRTDLLLHGNPMRRDGTADAWMSDPAPTPLEVKRTVRTYWDERGQLGDPH
jgi:hypothetical protein